ncbi:Beige/BEACH domain containing protein [Tritrichomonas foetus]|uniref:Beige/BEACH domain containing protein n=1 Tax=Tritrichomonas foetus TaxID=1144522 RepID=A0A1J4KWY5_9EUKA|nr:Beige/BEACH domain containing protein [Tritrichomonas foetus]|eukprot:OHT14214.1 Beige/BEACH domain containing protein [Tritrichomonas foetus]
MNRVFRFLASYVPKTDNSITIVSEIFKNRPNDPEPPIPKSISKLIPIIDDKSKSWTNTESVVQTYKLQYDVRAQLMNRLVTFFGSSSPSLSQNEYMAILTLQSCCALLFTPVESINTKDLTSFMNCLKNAIRFLPKNSKLVSDLFALIYERLLSIDDSCDITLILPPVQIIASIYPEFTSNCVNTNQMVFSRLSHLILTNKQSLNIDVISTQFFIISKAFSSNPNLDKEICKKMLPEVFLILSHLKNQRTISQIIYPIISLFIILKKHTNCDIFQLVELIKYLMENIHHLFEFPQTKTEFTTIERKEIDFKYIENQTFQKSVQSDLENINYFDNLMKYKEDKDFPLIKSSIILGQELKECPFDVTNQILTGIFKHFQFSYEYFVFLLLTIQQFDKYQHAICQCLSSLNLWRHIFGPQIFDPNIPKDSIIILLRQTLFESLSNLAVDKNAAQIISKKYCFFLKSIVTYPNLFAQVLQMSYPCFRPVYYNDLDGSIYEVIMHELIIQQEYHINGDHDAENYRIPTMTVLSALFQSKNALQSIITSKYFCYGMLHFLFEESVQDFFTDIIDRTIQYFSIDYKSNTFESSEIIEAFHHTLLYLIKKIEDERSLHIFIVLLNLFTRVISFEPSFISPLLAVSSSILIDIMSALVNLPKTEASNQVMEIGLMLLLALQNHPGFNTEAVPFSSIGTTIQKIGITDDILNIIYSLVFDMSNSRTITMPEALPLLLISVKNTDKYLDVLKLLIEICKNSVCNCCSCLMGNVPSLIFECTESKDIPYALELFTEISNFVSSRRSLFSFFRLFSSFNNTVLNPLMLPCIDSLEKIIKNSDSPEYCSLMQFSSKESIIRLPPLAIKDLQNGFVVSSKILLDSEYCNRVFFEFRNDTQELFSYFTDSTIYFRVNGNLLTPSFEIPVRKWFKLAFYFKSFQVCDVYINMKLVYTFNIPLSETPYQDFKKCSMFHKFSNEIESAPLQVQYATVSTKSNSWNLNINLNIPLPISYSQQNELKTFLNNSNNVFDFQADTVTLYESGKNILTKIPSSQYNGMTIRFFTNFLKVFEASHSVSFLVTLFAQIDFVDSATNSSHNLLDYLLSLLTLLITKSPENANNMLACNSYSIISYFLTESSASHLNITVWNSFLYQMKVMNSPKQKEMICQWILFNYKVWERSSLDTKIQIFSDWKKMTIEFPTLVTSYIHIPFLLYIFRGLIPSKGNIPKIIDTENISTRSNNKIENLIPKLTQARQIICSLLTTAISIGIKDTDSDLLFYSIVGCSEDLPAIELLDVVKKMLVHCDKSLKIPIYSDNNLISIPWGYLNSVISIKNTWASIYINLSQCVCCKFMTIYAETNYVNHDDTNKYCQYLIARRPYNKNNDNYENNDCDSPDKSLVTNSCRLMLKIDEGDSIRNMIEMDSLFLQLPVFFTYAVVSCISSSETMNDLFVQFFDKLCCNEANVTMLADKMTTYSLFYLMYWAVKRRPIALKTIAKIISKNPILTQNAINILDSFTITSGYDLSDLRSKLLNHVMNILSSLAETSLNQDLAQFGEVLALAILFRPKVISNQKLMKVFELSPFYDDYVAFTNNESQHENTLMKDNSVSEQLSNNESKLILEIKEINEISKQNYLNNQKSKEIPELENLASFYIVDPNPNSPVLQTFSLYYDPNGKWLEIDLAKRLISFLYTLWTNYDVDIHQSLCTLINMVIQESSNEDDLIQLPVIVDKLVQEFDVYDEFIHLIFDTINRFPNDSIVGKLFGPILASKYKTITEETFLSGFFALTNYCDQPPASLPGVTRELVSVFVSVLEQFPKTPKPLSTEIMHSLNEMNLRTATSLIEKHQISSRHWRSLWQQMTYDRSPFYLIRSEFQSRIHYKRSPLVDQFFRPSLKRNAFFNKHREASMKRDAYPPDAVNRIPRTNSSAMSSLPSHFNFVHEQSVESISEAIPIPNRYIWKARCELVKVTKTTEGSFVISANGFSFLNEDDDERIVIKAELVDMIFYQYMLQRPTAIELFTTTHKSYFFNFPDVDSHKFVSYFRSIPMPNARFIQAYPAQAEIARLDLTRKWVSREISTFEYLMWINELSGRSMNNLNAYPVFPWILSNYSCEKLDLNDTSIYRDLSKPVGALNPTRLAKLKLLKDSVPDINYLYQSTYSSIFMVLHLLVRLEPFTSVHIKYQDDKFDVASRMFTSIADCFQRCCDNNANFRELVPEFFFCPDFLLNNDNFDLGILPDGTPVNHVVLPPWAKTPEDFIHLHKQALESDYVSEHINQWIDLIFGCKQTGEEAEKADNTFDPRLYPNCWNNITDPNDITVTEDMLMKVGIIPQKIFDSPHPTRNKRPEVNKSGFTEIKVTNCSIIDTKINGESLEKYTIFSLHSDGRVFISRNNRTVSPVSKERFGKIAVHSSSLNDSVLFAFATENSSYLIVVKSNGSFVSKMSSLHIDAISCACFYQDEIITGGRDSILVKWFLNDKSQGLSNTKSLMAHADAVACVCASDGFGIIVSCSIDGLLVASTAHDFSFLMAVEMKLEPPFVPNQVLITEMIGRVIVQCANPQNKESGHQILFVYTLNGKLLHKFTHDKCVTAWCQAPRSDGFDFLVIADVGNNLYLYDAFDMKLIRKIFNSPSKITHLHYHRGIDLLAIGTESGALYVGSLFH